MNNTEITCNEIPVPQIPAPQPGGNLNAGYCPKPANFNQLMMLLFGSLGLLMVTLTIFMAGQIMESIGLMITGGVFYLITIGTYVCLSVMMLLYIYRAWKCVDSRIARTTPGKAIGFMFIPFYNFYWFFQAYLGLADDYNRSAEDNNSPVRMNRKLFQIFCILCICTAVPYIGLLACVPLLVYAPKVWREICEVINYHAEKNS